MTLEEQLEATEAIAVASLHLLHELMNDLRSVGLLPDRSFDKVFRAAIDQCSDHDGAATLLRQKIDPDGTLGF